MKQKKTLTDFKAEWEAIHRRLRILNPNYTATVAIKVGNDVWVAKADMNIRIAAQPHVYALTPENYAPAALTDADGKPLEPSVPAEVQAALDKMNVEMKAFLEADATFPEGDYMRSLAVVDPATAKKMEVLQ